MAPARLLTLAAATLFRGVWSVADEHMPSSDARNSNTDFPLAFPDAEDPHCVLGKACNAGKIPEERGLCVRRAGLHECWDACNRDHAPSDYDAGDSEENLGFAELVVAVRSGINPYSGCVPNTVGAADLRGCMPGNPCLFDGDPSRGLCVVPGDPLETVADVAYHMMSCWDICDFSHDPSEYAVGAPLGTIESVVKSRQNCAGASRTSAVWLFLIILVIIIVLVVLAMCYTGMCVWKKKGKTSKPPQYREVRGQPADGYADSAYGDEIRMEQETPPVAAVRPEYSTHVNFQPSAALLQPPMLMPPPSIIQQPRQPHPSALVTQYPKSGAPAMMTHLPQQRALGQMQPQQNIVYGAPPPIPPQPQSLFDRIDVNHDGVITREEFARATQAGQIGQTPQPRAFTTMYPGVPKQNPVPGTFPPIGAVQS